jgi:archaellum component FlaC
MPEETKKERLSRLEQELKELKATLPEHCSGTAGYVSVHHASTAHWQKIEDLEEEIAKLRAELES